MSLKGHEVTVSSQLLLFSLETGTCRREVAGLWSSGGIGGSLWGPLPSVHPGVSVPLPPAPCPGFPEEGGTGKPLKTHPKEASDPTG